MTEQGVGARLLRKEDDRLMRGRGQFVADLRFAGMKDVAFVRSPARACDASAESTFPTAHRGRRLHGDRSDGRQADPRRFRPARLQAVRAAVARARQGAPRRRARRHVRRADARRGRGHCRAGRARPRGAAGRARHAGGARAQASALLHEHWGDNVFLETFVDVEHRRKALDAPIKVTREIRTARQCMAPIEGRGVGRASGTAGSSSSSLYTATRCRTSCAPASSECLGLDEGQIRVVSPDVGGGFGYKGILLPEEVCLGWLAMRCGHPVRWIEDRREHLTAGANCREHHYRITGLCRPRRPPARHRLRGDRRFRRLFVLSVLGLPGSSAGREHPAGALRFSGLSLPHLFGRHQQVPDPALSRRRAHRRVLRARTGARRDRARGRASSRTRCA